jgi:ketosteroid isomerase-like protein
MEVQMTRAVGRPVLIALVGLALAGMAPAAASKPGQDDTQVLLASERDWAKAAVDADWDRLAGYMADDYLELAWEPAAENSPAHWATTPKKEWVASVRTQVYSSVEFHNLTVHLQGTLAVVTRDYVTKGASGGKDTADTGAYVNTWAKRGNRWLLVNTIAK